MRDEMIFFMDFVPSEKVDRHGDPELEEKRSEPIYAETKSIGQGEFYQAQTSGFKLERKFKITDYMDYQGQQYLIHSGMRYTILRTYRTSGNELEITCYGGVRDASAAISHED